MLATLNFTLSFSDHLILFQIIKIKFRENSVVDKELLQQLSGNTGYI